ncbi:MAG: hypothetical protein WA040_03455 [Anaerolineae bacterium]
MGANRVVGCGWAGWAVFWWRLIRYGRWMPWWTTAGGVRDTWTEYQKLALYLLGHR